MPHTKSCKKRLITSRARNERNRQNRAMMRTMIKRFRASVGDAAADEKANALSELYRVIDTQARKGLMPKRRASRLKSRMVAAAAK